MQSAWVTALLVRLGVGLLVILGAFLGLHVLDPAASSRLINITISAIAIAVLLAPTTWFKR